MKLHFYLSFALFLFSQMVLGQVPQSFSYQAVARNSAGNALANQAVGVRASILESSATGTAIYVETHTATTNAVGLFSLAIGTGNATTGTFAGINWATNTKFLKIDMDVTGSTDYQNVGTTQLLSVPYALQANKVTEKQTLTLTGNNLAISGGNNVTLPAPSAGGLPKLTTTQILALSNPAQFDQVFNIDTKKIYYYQGSLWFSTDKTDVNYSAQDCFITLINAPTATTMSIFTNQTSTSGDSFSTITGQFSSFSGIAVYGSFRVYSYFEGGGNCITTFFQRMQNMTSTDFDNATVTVLNALQINSNVYRNTNSFSAGQVFSFITHDGNGNGKKGLIRINSTNPSNIDVKVQQ